jgi:competence protein ComEA
VFDAPADGGDAAASEAGARRSRLVALAGICAAGLLAAAAVGVVAIGSAAAPPDIAQVSESPASSSPPGSIVVQVAGAVVRPGVYRFGSGSRVADAIEAAGGYGPRVDAERAERELDLAAKLIDGRTVRVPSRDDPTATDGTAAGSGSTGPGLVDLNHATLAELDALPGIGPVTAQKIVDARREKPFASADELRSRGILGDKAFARLKDLVTAR